MASNEYFIAIKYNAGRIWLAGWNWFKKINSLKKGLPIHSVSELYKNVQNDKNYRYFHHTFISDLSSGLGGSISMVIRYPEEEEGDCYSVKYSITDMNSCSCSGTLLLLFISCLSSALKPSSKIRSCSFPMTFSEVLLRSESNEDPGQAHQQRHHQVNSYPRVQNLVLWAWRPAGEQKRTWAKLCSWISMKAWQEQRRAHHSVPLEVGYRLIRSLVICWLRLRISAEKYTEKPNIWGCNSNTDHVVSTQEQKSD